ncbi:MAG TPA: hypothetical protein VF960_12625 [Chloroflexota bacterium]
MERDRDDIRRCGKEGVLETKKRKHPLGNNLELWLALLREMPGARVVAPPAGSAREVESVA